MFKGTDTSFEDSITQLEEWEMKHAKVSAIEAPSSTLFVTGFDKRRVDKEDISHFFASFGEIS